MTLADKTLTCLDCGSQFVFSTGEQAFYASKGYTNEPKRCPACREVRRAQKLGVPARQLYRAICAQCGIETQVPFQPRGDRPVYCSDCFSRVSPRAEH